MTKEEVRSKRFAIFLKMTSLADEYENDRDALCLDPEMIKLAEEELRLLRIKYDPTKSGEKGSVPWFAINLFLLLRRLNPEQTEKLRKDLPALCRRVKMKVIPGGKPDPEPSLKSKFTL